MVRGAPSGMGWRAAEGLHVGVVEQWTLGGRRLPGPPGNSLQLAGSSLPSTQSLSRSQTQTRGMQRLVMEHWNWLGAQVTSAAGGGDSEDLPTPCVPQIRITTFFLFEALVLVLPAIS